MEVNALIHRNFNIGPRTLMLCLISLTLGFLIVQSGHCLSHQEVLEGTSELLQAAVGRSGRWKESVCVRQETLQLSEAAAVQVPMLYQPIHQGAPLVRPLHRPLPMLSELSQLKDEVTPETTCHQKLSKSTSVNIKHLMFYTTLLLDSQTNRHQLSILVGQVFTLIKNNLFNLVLCKTATTTKGYKF